MAEPSFITVRGKALEYHEYGAGTAGAPMLVLLHEGLGCAALWRDFPAALAAGTGFRVVAVSRAGYGRSDPEPLPWPLDYMTRHAVDVLPGILDALGVQDCALVGHSDGATIAAIHGGRVRDARVQGIAVFAPHFFAEPMGLAAIAKARAAFDAGDLRARMAKYHSDPDNAFRGWNDSWLNPAFRDWTVEDVLDDITVPVLAIQGREDEYGTAAQVHAIARRCRGPVSIHLLDGCRHAPFLDQPEIVTTLVAGFAAGVLGDAAKGFWPDHAYVPGQSPRHADGAFDDLRDTVGTGLSARALGQTRAFLQGQRYHAAGFFWEAHELWEPVWMALPDGTADRTAVQAMIQLANAGLKLRMGRPRAAARLTAMARDLAGQVDDTATIGVSAVWLRGEADRLDALIE